MTTSLILCGFNKFSQLGEESNNKDSTGSPVISPPKALHHEVSKISSYSIFYSTAAFVTTKGEIFAVGENNYGQINHSIPNEILREFTKLEISDEEGFPLFPISVACCFNFTLYLVSASKNSSKYRLCYSYYGIRKDPLFLNIGNSNPICLFNGYRAAAVVDDEGSIFFIPSIEKFLNLIGSEIEKSHLPENDKPVSLAVGRETVLAVGLSGRIYESIIPNEGNILDFNIIKSLRGKRFIEVAGTYQHFFAITEDGRVFGRGSGGHGVLGDGNVVTTTEFNQISSLFKYRIVHAYAGCDHSFFQTDEGKILECGSNIEGQLIEEEFGSLSTYLAKETSIQNVKFCIAGWRLTAIFIGHDPLNSPNRRIVYDNMPVFHAIEETNNEAEIEKLKNEIIHLNTQVENKNKEIDELKNALANSQKTKVIKIDNYQDEISNLKKELVNKNKEINELKDQLSANSQQERTEESTRRDEISNLQAELEKKNNEINELKNIIFIKSQQRTNKQPNENNFIDEDSEFFSEAIKIGEGATSIAYKIYNSRTKTPICKKVLKYRKGQTTIKDAKNALKEFDVLRSISHPCICKAIGINFNEVIQIINDDNEEQNATTIAIFLEFIDYSLVDVLKKKISNTSKARIALDVAHAMNYLHKNGMMHRDLKIENIMINSLFETKLVDFGLASISESVIDGFSYVEDSLTRGIGTLSYMSPEMANEEEYDNKTDVYSFGVFLHVLFSGKLPKQNIRDKVTGKKAELSSPSKSISEFCIKLIENCMSNKPSERPSFDEILIQMRENFYQLASEVDSSLLSRRDKELDIIENYK